MCQCSDQFRIAFSQLPHRVNAAVSPLLCKKDQSTMLAKSTSESTPGSCLSNLSCIILCFVMIEDGIILVGHGDVVPRFLLHLSEKAHALPGAMRHVEQDCGEENCVPHAASICRIHNVVVDPVQCVPHMPDSHARYILREECCTEATGILPESSRAHTQSTNRILPALIH